MLNHVELLGRLAQEPEIRYTQSGTPVASFDLAVQVPSKNKDTAPDYIPIVCWRERAEFCGRYGGNANGNPQPANNDGFMDIPDDGQLPFN